MYPILPQEDFSCNRMEVILLFANDGRSIKEIAHDLLLAEATVIRYLRLAVSTLPANETRVAKALLDGLDALETEAAE